MRALKRQQPVAAAWGGSGHIKRVPAPGSPATPTGVYAVSIDGGSPGGAPAPGVALLEAQI